MLVPRGIPDPFVIGVRHDDGERARRAARDSSMRTRPGLIPYASKGEQFRNRAAPGLLVAGRGLCDIAAPPSLRVKAKPSQTRGLAGAGSNAGHPSPQCESPDEEAKAQ